MAPTSAPRRILVLLALGFTLAIPMTFVGTPSAHAFACTPADIRRGTCDVSASADSDQVNLVGTATTPGDRGTGGGRNVGGAASGGASTRDNSCAEVRGNRCYGTVPKPGTPAAASAPTPAITLRDLAGFRPTPGTQQMEPNGWVVPGLDANFYAIVGQQRVPGTLLGQPATVRFTPTAYHWNYGDNQAAVRSTKGGTWAQLGLADFDPTPTSHVYVTEGEYIIRLTIDFRAEYQFGSNAFRPVVGTISLPANDLRVTVTGAKTVLVEHDCVANPSGPGC